MGRTFSGFPEGRRWTFSTRSFPESRRHAMPRGSTRGAPPGFQNRKWVSGATGTARTRRPFGGAGAGPLLDGTNLRVREAAFVREVAMTCLGQPGRHIAATGYGCDLRGALPGVLVSQQGKRSALAGTVATSAV